MATTHKDASTHAGARCDRVDPADRVGVVSFLSIDLEELVEVFKSYGFDLYERARNRMHFELKAQNNTRKSKLSGGCPRVRVVCQITFDNLARGCQYLTERTWSAKVPSTWWFLPWMSFAKAPPTVTNCVPGRQAERSHVVKVSMSSFRVTPASHLSQPVCGLDQTGQDAGQKPDRFELGRHRHSTPVAEGAREALLRSLRHDWSSFRRSAVQRTNPVTAPPIVLKIGPAIHLTSSTSCSTQCRRTGLNSNRITNTNRVCPHVARSEQPPST